MNHSKTEEKIILAFCNLLLIKEFKDISIKDIITEAGIARTTFYNYYDSKKEFTEEAVNFIFDEITYILNADLTFQSEVLLEMLTYLHHNKEITLVFINKIPNIKEIVREYIKTQILNSNIPNLDTQLTDAYGLPFNYSLNIYIETIESIIFSWINNNFKETPEQIVKFINHSVRI